MNAVRARNMESRRIQAALAELQDLIRSHYPTAEFAVGRDPDEAASLNLYATVDVDDTDDVTDLVMDRVLDMQIEEGLPIHVMPRQTPEREAAARAREREQDERDGDGGYERRLAELTAMRQRHPYVGPAAARTSDARHPDPT